MVRWMELKDEAKQVPVFKSEAGGAPELQVRLVTVVFMRETDGRFMIRLQAAISLCVLKPVLFDFWDTICCLEMVTSMRAQLQRLMRSIRRRIPRWNISSQMFTSVTVVTIVMIRQEVELSRRAQQGWRF